MICSYCNKEFQILQINKTKAVCICTPDCDYNKGSNVIVINRNYSDIAKPNKKEITTAKKQEEDLDEFLLDVYNKCCDTDCNSVSEGQNSTNLENEFSKSNLVTNSNLEQEPFDVNKIFESLTQSTDFSYTDVSPDFLDMFLSESNK